MQRRLVLKSLIAGGAVFSAAGITWFSISPENQPLTIKQTINTLNTLHMILVTQSESNSEYISSAGQWKLGQIFEHCAQSVEYSMTGYPEHKSALFKNTLGHIAFSAFSAKGKMTHSLHETIPGAPQLSLNQDVSYYLLALSRLRKSLTDFESYAGTLMPHFAYGALTKAEYELAHVMHINNHLSEIITRT